MTIDPNEYKQTLALESMTMLGETIANLEAALKFEPDDNVTRAMLLIALEYRSERQRAAYLASVASDERPFSIFKEERDG